jgi:hypothetical protein
MHKYLFELKSVSYFFLSHYAIKEFFFSDFKYCLVV